jgi:hypothetical protein
MKSVKRIHPCYCLVWKGIEPKLATVFFAKMRMSLLQAFYEDQDSNTPLDRLHGPGLSLRIPTSFHPCRQLRAFVVAALLLVSSIKYIKDK